MSICAAATRGLPTIAVIPRPTAAGVFGIARTMGDASPSMSSNSPMVVPAAIDTNRVEPLPSSAISGSASPIICGFTAIRITAGLSGRPSFT